MERSLLQDVISLLELKSYMMALAANKLNPFVLFSVYRPRAMLTVPYNNNIVFTFCIMISGRN